MKDKYSIIIKYDTNCDLNDYKYFFENLIKNNKRVMIPTYIYCNLNMLRDKEGLTVEKSKIHDNLLTSIESCITDSLNEYIRRTRQEVRNSIKINRGTCIINTYLNCIKKFNNKINTLNSFLNKNNSTDIFRIFFNTLFCDPFVHNTNILRDEIMDIRNYKDVKFLTLKIKKLCNNFYVSWYLPFLLQCIKGSLNLEINNPDVNKCMIPVYQYSIFVNYFNTYRTHFNYLLKELFFMEILSSILIKDIFNPLSKLNNISNFNIFLEQNYKSLNFIGKSLSRDSKESIELHIANNSNSDINSDTSLEKVCNFYVTITKYYSNTFPTLCSLFCKKISHLIINNNLYDELNKFILKTINNERGDFENSNISLQSSHKSLDYCSFEAFQKYDSKIANLVNIIFNLSNKDIIFKNYHICLMNRLLNYQSVNDLIDIYGKKNFLFEMKLISNLSKCFNNNQIFILKKTLFDYSSSLILNYELKPQIIKPTIISNNIWDLSILTNETNFDVCLNNCERSIRYNNNSLVKYISNYSTIFTKYHDDTRSLNWYLHVGKVTIRYNNTNCNCILTLLPIQALVLEQFDEIEEQTLEEINNFTFLRNYPKEEINNLLRVFSNNRILRKNNDIFVLNKEFNKKELDLRKSYFDISRVLKESFIDEDIKLSNSRIDIVMSVINSLLKTHSYSKTILYELTCENIKLFELNNELFNSSIDYLKSRDYIKESNFIFEKINY
jgi:hypothetical protein